MVRHKEAVLLDDEWRPAVELVHGTMGAEIAPQTVCSWCQRGMRADDGRAVLRAEKRGKTWYTTLRHLREFREILKTAKRSCGRVSAEEQRRQILDTLRAGRLMWSELKADVRGGTQQMKDVAEQLIADGLVMMTPGTLPGSNVRCHWYNLTAAGRSEASEVERVEVAPTAEPLVPRVLNQKHTAPELPAELLRVLEMAGDDEQMKAAAEKLITAWKTRQSLQAIPEEFDQLVEKAEDAVAFALSRQLSDREFRAIQNVLRRLVCSVHRVAADKCGRQLAELEERHAALLADLDAMTMPIRPNDQATDDK